MEDPDILSNFLSITGCDDSSLATTILENNNWDVERSVDFFFTMNDPSNVKPTTSSKKTSSPPTASSSSASSEFDYNEDEFRDPIPQKMDKLVDHYYQPTQRSYQKQTNVFEAFRDFEKERGINQDKATEKQKSLSELFKPPLDILTFGTFDEIKKMAEQKKYFVLVNIQDVQEFDCQKLNRDTWSNKDLKELIGENFVFWQVNSANPEGKWFTQIYPVFKFPYIAIIDPRTGQKLQDMTGFIDAEEMAQYLVTFLSTNSFSGQIDPPPSSSSSGASKKQKKYNTEDEELELAIALSLKQEQERNSKSGSTSPLSQQQQQQQQQNNNNNNNNTITDEGSLNVPTNRLWDGTHTLKYRYLTAEEMEAPNVQSGSNIYSKPPIKELGTSKLINFLRDDNAFTLTTNDTTTYEIIALLRCLYMFSLDPLPSTTTGLNPKSVLSSSSPFTSERSLVNLGEFVSQKLTAKIMRQLQDPLALCGGVFPDWCKQLLGSCSFLFPFDCKRLFFYSTSFGIARALSTLQQRQDLIRQTTSTNGSDRGGDFRVGRIQRQKVRIYRNKVLESAIKVMDLYGKSKSILEVEYFGEAGTGLGPTLEFFTLVSKELQRKDLNLWYTDNNDQIPDEDDDKMKIDSTISTTSTIPPISPIISTTTISSTTTTTTTTTPPPPTSLSSNTTTTITTPIIEQLTIIHQYIYSSGGLFPKPINPNITIEKKTLEYFKFLGMFIAKAFFDQRLIDLPLSKPMYKYMIDQELNFDDLRQLAPTYASSLNRLYSLVTSIKQIQARSDLDGAAKKEEVGKLRVDGAVIEDLCLDFTLPGFAGWELKPNGEQINVTLDNIEEYLNLIVKNFLYDGVIRQITSFKEGFNQTFPISSLKPFTISEVESLLCGSLTGSESDWTLDSLMDSTKADHGYTLQSKSVQNIFQIMSEFTPQERKQFLLFISGSPHLPLQGFKGLIPRLTIVKKHHSPPLTPDDYLLSVMSCTNYIKLPDYSTREVMKEKLLYAMNEGQSSFHLS